MKRLSFIPLAAFLFAIMLSAFTEMPKKVRHTYDDWYYTLPTSAGEDEPSNYVPLDGQDESCVSQEGVVCVINAPVGDPGEPDLSQSSISSYKP